MTHYGHALRSAADPLEADKQVVKRHGLALYHAAPSLTADREVVMAAVERRSGVEVEWGSGVAECQSVVGSEAKWSCTYAGTGCRTVPILCIT